VQLHQCSHDELINAYDNTIVYADHVIGRAIALLKGLSPTPALLIYVSDHGQSLGEHGLYLHGMPNAIAPEEQRTVPFLVWMSDSFQKRKSIPAKQLAAKASHSHANVFHSVMGAFDMRSEIYRADLDIFNEGAGSQ
jgi:lipid A ethanolaminephosphotransferase